ncbi:MAG: DsbA family protein [Deltaproteobacteria bacterium]|nr:DsbA family protein [Deltaproteobacteria bacterium]
MRIFILICAIVFSLTANADSICEKLNKDESIRAEKLSNEIKLYDCCDDTVNNCLSKDKVCKLAIRIKDEICLLIREKLKDESIKAEISNRAKSMTPQLKKPEIEYDEQFMAGAMDSKVTVVSYICARCPFCSIIIPKLYKEITVGRLKGKARLFIRPFPLKSHEYSVEGGIAMVAAAKTGKFYDYLLKMQEDFINFSLPRLSVYAAEADIDVKRFEELLGDPENKKYLEKSKKEGMKNGVEATPAFFINGKKYFSNYHIDLLTDAILEEYERITGDIYR